MHIFLKKQSKNLAGIMVREENHNQISIEEFKTPFELGLDKRNRWVKLASLLPWDELAKIYTRSLNKRRGRPSKPSRLMIGAVIIKHKLRLPDEEVIPAIQENPYLQYFLGFKEFSHKKPFDPSLFVTIRKRLGNDDFNEMTDALLERVSEIEKISQKLRKGKSSQKNKQPKSNGGQESKSDNQVPDDDKRSGMLLLDASVAPADIKYPTDLDLLNKSREHSERIIDGLWQQLKTPGAAKPRTYRRLARKDYLNMAKKRKKKPKELRKSIRKQLNYLNRNLNTINMLLDQLQSDRWPLDFYELRLFWIIQEVYRQQKQMFAERTHKISDRIVSVSQPHVRPIVRGKAGKNVEFGAKISASVVDGYAFLDRLSWDAYHEASDLPDQVEGYKRRFGFYPKVVITDGLYRTRKNLIWLSQRNIRLSGKPLGRPPKETPENTLQLKAERKRRQKENGIRSRVEGKFGEGKRGYDLNLVKAKLPETSESWIATIFFVMNIADLLRYYLFVPIRACLRNRLIRLFMHVKEQFGLYYKPIML